MQLDLQLKSETANYLFRPIDLSNFPFDKCKQPSENVLLLLFFYIVFKFGSNGRRFMVYFSLLGGLGRAQGRKDKL